MMFSIAASPVTYVIVRHYQVLWKRNHDGRLSFHDSS
jgi:hypothetical protein